MTYQPDNLWKAVRVLLPLEFHPNSSVCVLGNFIFFYSGSSATLSPWKSGESCHSKDQREDPLTCSTEANQTKRGNRPEWNFR